MQPKARNAPEGGHFGAGVLHSGQEHLALLIFFLVSSLAGFFSSWRETSRVAGRCLPGGADSQECHELLSTPSHIGNEGEESGISNFSLHICLDYLDCMNQQSLTSRGNSLKNHCSVFRICFQNPEL